MNAARRQTRPRARLNLRVRPELRGLIDRAAQVRGTTRTEFILEAAKRAAEDALLDRTLIAVSRAAYEAFLRRLDAPPRPNARLWLAMKAPPPWKSG